MSDIIHTPIPLNVTNRPVLLQPVAQDFQIINTDLNATVWAANNPSIVPGQGTPIPPGTSLTWQSPGNVYLILGNDTLSLTAAKAAIIISYDVADWSPSPAAIAAAVLNSGVLIIDQPVELLSNVTIGVNSSSALIDVSRYNSLDILIRSVGATTGYAIIGFHATAAGGVSLGNISVPFVSGVATNAGFSTPVRGAYMRISTANGLSLNPVYITASYRQLAATVTTLIGSTAATVGNNALLYNSQAALLGFGTTVYTETCYFGEVEISATAIAGGAIGLGTKIQIFAPGAAAFGQFYMMLDGSGGSWQNGGNTQIVNKQRYSCYGGQLGLLPVVGGAVAATVSISVIPVIPNVR